MNNIIVWCNQNQGFLSAILSLLALSLSVLTMIMTYRLGKMPFKKKVKMIPVLYKKNEDFYIDLTLINSGNATLCIKNIGICNNEMLNIGLPDEWKFITLKPCDYYKVQIRLYDDLENIETNQLDLNNHIIIVADDVDGRRYKASKGFPVG